MNEENQNQLFQVTTWKNKYDNNNNDQCWHYDELKFFEICFIAAAEKTFSVNNDWWVLFNIYKQQLSVKTDTFLTAVSTVMSDDAADSNTVTDAWEWAEQEHADMMCMIYSDSNDMKKHSVHNAALS